MMFGFGGQNIKPNSTVVMSGFIQRTVRKITLLAPDQRVFKLHSKLHHGGVNSWNQKPPKTQKHTTTLLITMFKAIKIGIIQ